MKTEFEWYFGFAVDWFFYSKSGSYGMYCQQIRHHWIGIPWIIGVRITKTWGYDW